MSKITGLGDSFQLDDSGGTLRDISSTVDSVQVGTSQGLIEVTGLDKFAAERITSLGDGSFQISGPFDAATNKAHDVFTPISAVRTATYDIGGTTTGNPRLSMEVVIANYNISRDSGGKLTWTATLNLANGTVPAWSTAP